MGYTHYWRRPAELDADAFADWTTDVAKILDAGIVPVQFEYDDASRPPQVEADTVRFNGVGEGGHETFAISRIIEASQWQEPDARGWYFDFCKTALKPYDVVVCACLIRLAARFPEGVQISSDGDASEWEPARRLVERLFGHATVPLGALA